MKRCPFAAARDDSRLSDAMDDARLGAGLRALTRSDIDLGENWWIEAIDEIMIAKNRNRQGGGSDG